MKERKISRRAVCSAMVASLALGVLEGCGSSSSTTASSAAGSGAAASNERITVRILKSKAANEVAAEQMDVWKVLGEKFNMDFEFDNPPQDNYNERLNLVMMDAQLPDIIMDMPTTEVLKYGESGVILSLNDYIENNMPNLKKEIDKRDGVEKALTYSDGNIYYMPMLDEKVSGNMPYIVRTDWLEKLGIESPVTLEDWENYWHLVKTTDLNGNGTNDEIPFSSYNMDGLRNFCTAFGCLDDFYTDPDDGGKVHYGPIDPMYGDNVFEKRGINRDRTGDREKTRYLCGKQGIFTRDRALIRPGFIRQLETRASTRSASFFHALGSPGRPHNGGGAAGAYRTRNGAKPLKQGHLRAKRGPLGPSRKSQQQTKRTGFAAHGHSIAETAPEGKRAKRAKRANGALIRA